MSDTVDLRDVRGRLVRFLFAIPLGVATTSVVLGALPNEGESSMVLDGLIFAIVSSFAWAAAFGYFYRKSEAVRELRRLASFVPVARVVRERHRLPLRSID